MPFPRWFTRAALPCALPFILPLAAPAAPAAPAGAQTLVLKNVSPGQLLDFFRRMREHPSTAPGMPTFPSGVTRITARPQDNALVVDATPEGFNFVREVAHELDFPTRSVSLTVAFLRVGDAQMATLGGLMPLSDRPGEFSRPALGGPDALAAFLKRARPVPAGTVTTTNNVPVSLTLPAPGVRSVALTLTPRLNADGTVTVTNHEEVAEELSGAVGPGVAADAPTVAWDSTRTVRDGGPMTFILRLFDPDGLVPNDLLIVVTPTTLPGTAPAAPRP